MQLTTRCAAFLAGLVLVATTALAQPEESGKEAKTARDWAPLLQSKNLDEQRLAAVNLAKMGRESVEVLKELRAVLTAKDDVLRFYAVRAIANGGPAAKEAIPDLVRILEEDNPVLARPTALSLAQLGKDAVAPAAKLLESTNPRLRRSGVLVLGKLGTAAEATLPALLKRLTDDDSYLVRRRVAEALEQSPINTPAVRAALIQVLRKDGDPDVTSSAALALGKIGTDALPELLKLLDDTSADARYLAALALRQMRSEAVPAVKPLTKLLTESDDDLRRAGISALASIGEPALPALIETLRDPRAVYREGALVGLTEMGLTATRALKPVVAALEDKEIAVARQAALALGAMADAAGVKPLIKALESPDLLLRTNAIVALGQIGEAAREAVPMLAEKLRLGERTVREKAAMALLRIGKPSQTVVQKMLSEKEPRVRILCLIVLGRLGGSEAVSDIAARLKDDDAEVRFFAARAIRGLGRSARSAQEAIEAALKVAKEPELQNELREALIAVGIAPKD